MIKGRIYFLLVFLLFKQIDISAQCGAVSGRIFTDFNEDGIFEAPTEAGIPGVEVRIYDNDNALIGFNISDSDGLYSINTSGALANTLCPDGSHCYRVEFILPPDYVAWGADADLGTETQRVCDNTCTANLSAYNVHDYCEDDPTLTTNCYIDGDNTGTEDVLISLNYINPTSVEHESQENQIGTTYGLAYSKSAGSLFATAFQKRFSGYGPGSPGSIYLVDNPADNMYSGALFLDLNTLYGSDVAGTDPHDFTTVGISGEVTDTPSFNAVGRMSFGDTELSEDELTLYTINLNDRSLYSIPLGTDPANPVAPTTTAAITVTPLADPTNPLPDLPAGIANEEIIPFGLEVHRGLIYIGLVSNGQTSGNTANMYGLVYSFDGTNFSKVLEYPLNYGRGCGFADDVTCFGPADWAPWTTTNVYPTPQVPGAFNEEGYPMPILGDMQFDIQGNMIVSMRDRWGDMGGYYKPKPDDDGTLTASDAFGDILYAVNNGNGTWSINIADFTDNTNSVATTGATAFPCPDGETVLGGDCYNATGYLHEETSYSGMAIHYPSNEFVTLSMDPDVNAFSSGVEWFDLQTLNPSRAYEILTGSINPAFGKGNSLGDLELICRSAPIEIGNYVWYDTDSDGIQDPCELPLDSIIVNLYDDLGNLVGTDTTINGRYYFGGEGNVGLVSGNPLSYAENYEIRIDLSEIQDEVQNLNLNNGDIFVTNAGTTDDRADNDGVLAGGGTYASVSLTTGNPGDNNHDYDFGFYACETLANPSVDAVLCNDEVLPILSVETSATGVDAIRFVSFTSQQTGVNMYTGGTTLGTATPAGGTAALSNISFPYNDTGAELTYYVYALLNPVPDAADCRPFEEIEVIVLPELDAQLNTPTCYNNYTNNIDTDDYYTFSLTVNASRPGPSNQYEVVLGAASDGSGGTVIATANYGTEITIGTGAEFLADGTTEYLITVRDTDNNLCRRVLNTGTLEECSECPTRACGPVSLRRL